MTAKFTLESNRDYWEDPQTVSILDLNLHELEIRFVSKFLRPVHVMADVGCGDGTATLRYAESVKYCYGIEPSSLLRKRANRALAGSGQNNVKFVDGDIFNLSEYEEIFDLVVSQRVLINLPSWEWEENDGGG